MTSTPQPRAGAGSSLLEPGGAWKGLAGFFLSGLLFSFLGVILPIWGHHLEEDYITAGNYFLAMNLGIFVSFGAARLARGRGLSLVLALACGLACAALVYLAFLPPAVAPFRRIAGIFVLGCGAGLLNIGVLRAISPLYRREPAATVNLAGAMFGIGCVLMAVLVAGTYYAYSVTTILLLIALLPALFIPIYAKARFATENSVRQPSFRQAFSDFRSPAAVLFALLLFFQFGNEWAVAGWLPLFLIQRLGISPETSLVLLAFYWIALLIGRVVILAILPSVPSGKVLMTSVPAALFGCAILLSTDNRFGATVGIFLVGGGFASVYPLVVEKIGVRFPYYHPGFFNGIFSFALTGGMLAPWSLGLFADLWGIRVVMLLPLLGTLMVFILLMLIWAEARFGSIARPATAQNKRIGV
jgi:MFS transporter, FHS family, glucose/mannose:H+ symporter